SGSSTAAALIVTNSPGGTDLGAVYKPSAPITPTIALPPEMSLMNHATPGSPFPETVAVNWTVWLTSTLNAEAVIRTVGLSAVNAKMLKWEIVALALLPSAPTVAINPLGW